MEEQVPLWNVAVEGKPDWDAIYSGFHAAVDWPTSAFWRDLIEAYPRAKIILSSRSASLRSADFSEAHFLEHRAHG